MSTANLKKLAPWLAMVAAIVAAMVTQLLAGRLWWCVCGRPFLWSGDIWSQHNSQHLADPYTFTHVTHGMLLCGLFAWLTPRLSIPWRLAATVAIEAFWETIENLPIIIDRYREETAAVGYTGDTIINSLGDTLSCALGFWIARRIGLWPSIVVIVVTEIVLLFWIRDNLSLNILMLLYPLESLKQWQLRP